jgi:hypothetical protein
MGLNIQTIKQGDKAIMKWLRIILAMWWLTPALGYADVVILKSGRRIETTKAWEEGGQIKFYQYGNVVGYPKSDVERIEVTVEVVEEEPTMPDEDDALIEQTSQKSAARMTQVDHVNVFYEKADNIVRIEFTPQARNLSWAALWTIWRDNQVSAYKTFRAADITVRQVSIETENPDQTGRIKIIHPAGAIEQAAASGDTSAWMRSGRFMQKKTNDTEWREGN